MYACMRVCMYVCMYVYIHVYICVLPKGASTSLKLSSFRQGRKVDPARVHHGQVMFQWATSNWEQYPPRAVLQTCLEGAALSLSASQHPWRKVADPAAVYLLTCARLGWRPISADILETDQGLRLDLTRVSPKMVEALAQQATLRWSDRQAMASQFGKLAGHWVSPVHWDLLGRTLEGKTSQGWERRQQAALRSVLSGVQWPQARQHREGLSLSWRCQACQGEEGTLWHRRYACPAAGFYLRLESTSNDLRRAAAEALEAGPGTAEAFARGLFPVLDALVPPPMAQDRIRWYNRPDGGRLSGIIFTDGSSLRPDARPLRRAGWSVVQTDQRVNVMAAAYGPVPGSMCPDQVARDGEDYALVMVGILCDFPATIYVDCQGTIDTFEQPYTESTGSGNPRAHLWRLIWSKLRGRPVLLAKTKAHATEQDVLLGRTTWWQKRGNDAADRFARLGAEVHGVTARQEQQVRACMDVAKQAARWAGTQEAHLASREFRDSQELEGSCDQRPRGLRVVNTKLPAPAYSGSLGVTVLSQEQESNLFGHSLRVAVAPKGGLMLCCTACGAYGWKRAKALTSECQGPAAGPGLRNQRSRLAQGIFPSAVGGTSYLGELRAPSRHAVLWLAQRVLSREGAEPSLTLLGGQAPIVSLSREATLAAHGLTEASLERMVHLRACEEFEPFEQEE